MELTFSSILILTLTGFLAGGINTLAGGGSNLTIPALIVLGLPADIANGTNRIAILLQSIVGVVGYDKYKSLDRPAVIPILVPTIIGGIFGAIAAAIMPNLYLKPVLLISILSMSILILVKPEIIAPAPGTPILSPTKHLGAWWGLFAAGICASWCWFYIASRPRRRVTL